MIEHRNHEFVTVKG